jgi:hypothetical protein
MFMPYMTHKSIEVKDVPYVIVFTFTIAYSRQKSINTYDTIEEYDTVK